VYALGFEERKGRQSSTICFFVVWHVADELILFSYGSNSAKWPNEILPSYTGLKPMGGKERRHRHEDGYDDRI
jgi:hypothetical protein